MKGIRHLVVKNGDSELVGSALPARPRRGRAQHDFRENRVVADLMNTHVVTVGPEASVKEAANLMRGRTIGCLPVVKEGPRNQLVGIVTVSDLLELLGRGIDRPSQGRRAGSEGPRPARGLEGETNALGAASRQIVRRRVKAYPRSRLPTGLDSVPTLLF